MKDRLQKILARSGYGSRRTCEELIQQRRVTVNGKIATLGMKADPARDKICLDGKPIAGPERKQYIAFNKPAGVLSTVGATDPRPTVRDYIHISGRLYPVGRLDLDSEGLILMTNDGELTNRLTHPRYEHEKEYRVLVEGKPTPGQLNPWRQGVPLVDGEHTLPAQVLVESRGGQETWLTVTLREGKNRQIRRMGEATGLSVRRIIRTRMAAIHLGDLKTGEWRHLTEAEIKQLKETV